MRPSSNSAETRRNKLETAARLESDGIIAATRGGGHSGGVEKTGGADDDEEEREEREPHPGFRAAEKNGVGRVGGIHVADGLCSRWVSPHDGGFAGVAAR